MAPKSFTASSNRSPTSSSSLAAEPNSPRAASNLARLRNGRRLMSALKNQFQRARAILDSLVQGVHPRTGDDLPGDSVINEIDVSRAMLTAVFALDQISARLARRSQLPESV